MNDEYTDKDIDSLNRDMQRESANRLQAENQNNCYSGALTAISNNGESQLTRIERKLDRLLEIAERTNRKE